ncbi:hypothetical protein Syun_023540 [Stephania yunnanensis]|uniref:Uncharacterized protein n=1 Tax=Stephania yunnanensis TaxID=152371 RepID=A0AAP0FPD3_9MAGN
MGKSELFDLEHHFAFYSAYHSNPTNVLIHMTFVWPNFFTSLVFLHFTPTLLPVPPIEIPQLGTLVFNAGFLLTLVHAVCFVCLDKIAGSLAALFAFLCWVGASSLGTHLGFNLAWKVGLAVHFVCWTGQITGHRVFETLQMFLMYEPYPGFHESVKAKTEIEIKKWKARVQKKAT